MNYNDFMMSIGQNEKILDLLSPNEKSYVQNFVNERKREIAKMERMRKMDELKRKKEIEMKRNKLLGLEYGEWVRNIPKYERFVIAVRDGKRFMGWNINSDLEDPTKWKSIKECCAIDILRGYKSPYWGYYVVPGDDVVLQANAFYENRVSKVMLAENDDELVKVLDYNWNFFKYDNTKSDAKFGILDYIVDSEGKITVLGVSEYKTLREHLEDLKSKYMK